MRADEVKPVLKPLQEPPIRHWGHSFTGGKMKSTLINERVLGRSSSTAGSSTDVGSKFKVALSRINQELWLVLSLFIIAALFNWLVASHRMILGLYTLPTIFSAYVYGRRHAVLTASASIFMVLILIWKNAGLFSGSAPFEIGRA